MLKIWKDTWKTTSKAAEESMDVVMSGAADREPVDSAVRVIVPTQRQKGATSAAIYSSENSKRGVKRTASEEEPKDATESHQTKRHRTEADSIVDDMVVLYDSTPPQAETELYTRLYSMDTEHALTRQFKHARRILTELGPCAADLLWREALEDRATAKAAGQGKMNTTIREFIETWSFDMPNPSPLSSNYNVCPQFTRLVEVLQSCEVQDTSFRGMIIVKRPVIAAMIVELLKALDDMLPDLRPYAIIGPSAFDDADQQRIVLETFAAGTYNLVVTTKYAEYLELPRLSAVIQYNLFEKPPMHVLSRAHLSFQDTLVIHMVEHGNDLHKRLLQSYRECGLEITQSVDSVVGYCARHASEDGSEDDQDESEYIQDPITEQRIYARDSNVVIHRVAPTQKLEFQLRQDNQGWYICSLNFPMGRQVRTVEGTAQPSISEAKDSASYHVCRQLFDKGLLDYRLFPHTAMNRSGQGGPEAEKDGQSANASSTTRCYSRKLPRFWSNTLHISKDKLYPLIISVGQFRHGHHAPILILTRFWLPDLQDFPVFSSGSRAMVRLQRGAPLRMDEARLKTLYRYTLRVSRAIINKPMDSSVESMPYFIAPVDAKWDLVSADYSQEGFPIVTIPWADVEFAANHWATPLVLDAESPEGVDMRDAIIQDRTVEFTNRHFVVKVRHDMTPLSKAEDGEREAGYANFLEYCKSRRKEFSGLKNENQPLVEVSPVPACVNNLSPSSRAIASSKYPARYLIPELCCKFTIPASVFCTALLLPSIVHAIDSFLLVKEINATIFDNAIAEDQLHAAVVSPTTSMEHDYERLELLGDAFLKYSTSTYFYVTMPTAREGALHGARQKVISNKALRIGAIEAGLPAYIQSKPVVPKIWQPHVYSMDDSPREDAQKAEQEPDSVEKADVAAVGDSGESPPTLEPPKQAHSIGKRKRQREEHSVQWLGDKTVADVVEAIIGAAFLTAGRDLALRAAKNLHVPFPAVEKWSDFSRASVPIHENYRLPTQAFQDVESIVDYKFKQPALLAEALTHSSASHHNGKSYDRLEFLGDAVLDFLTVTYVFHSYPNLSPGGLSLLKGAMVSNATLATICVLTGLYEHLQYSSSDLSTTITVYAEKVRALRDAEHRLAEKEDRAPCQFWLEIEPPKALSDIVESVMGAMYVSDDYDISGAEKFFNDTLKPFFDRHIRLQTLSDHPNTTLTDLFHAESCQQHSVSKEADGSTVRYDVVVHGIVLASASDPISNAALRRAATAALDVLANDPGFMTRVCDCRATRQSKKAQKKKGQVKQTEQGSMSVDESPRVKQEDSDDEMTVTPLLKQD